MAEPPIQPKRKRRKAGELRRDILNAAREVFMTKGYAASSTREIAERAQAAEPLIFRQFERKSKLFAAAVFEPLEAMLDERIEWTRSHYGRPLPPEESMRQYIGAVLQTVRANRRLLITYINAIVFHADDFAFLTDNYSSPAFEASLLELERSGRDHPANNLLIHDQHIEPRLILLFLMAVGMFDDLFFTEEERSEDRVFESVVKLMSMGTGLRHGKAGAVDRRDTDPAAHETIEALRAENAKLRNLYVEQVLQSEPPDRAGDTRKRGRSAWSGGEPIVAAPHGPAQSSDPT